MRNRREDFPLLRDESAPAYLDNACVTLKPDAVIEAVNEYYTMRPACGGRSVHRLGTSVSRTIAASRRLMADHIGARNVEEVAFMKNATHALNQVAQGLSWDKGDVVLTTDKEHNSNLVPWLELERSHGVDHRVLPSTSENTFDLEGFEATCAELTHRLKMVSIGHVSNLDGVAAPIEDIAKIPCNVEVSSEFRYRNPILLDNTLFVTLFLTCSKFDFLPVEKLSSPVTI